MAIAKKKGLRGAAREEDRKPATIPETRTRMVALGDLTPAEFNPRAIDPDAESFLHESFRRYGMVQPIVWNERTGNIVGGHRKLEFLQKEGITDTEVIVVSLDDADERMLNLTLNNPRAQGYFLSDNVTALLEEMSELVTAVEIESLGLAALAADFKFEELATELDKSNGDPSAGAAEPTPNDRSHSVTIKFPSKKKAREFFTAYSLELNDLKKVDYKDLTL